MMYLQWYQVTTINQRRYSDEPLEKLNHTIYECTYHVVWIPKYRYRVMTGDVRYYVRDSIRKLSSWKKLPIAVGNVCSDHVHLVVEIPPNWSVSQVIGYLKGKSALKIFDRFPHLSKKVLE